MGIDTKSITKTVKVVPIPGLIKVPTNNIYSKKSDGKSIWYSFVKRSINLLKDDGMLSFIIPSI